MCLGKRGLIVIYYNILELTQLCSGDGNIVINKSVKYCSTECPHIFMP